MSDKIQARIVLEMMGRPAEHLKETLNTLVVRMGSEKGVNIVEKQYYDPQPVEKAENLFSTFAEVEADFESLKAFFNVIFSYMPSNVEIVSPEKFKMQNADTSELANFILQRLHQYDAVTKQVVHERDILKAQLNHAMGKGPAPSKPLEQKPAKKTSKKKKTTKKK